MLSNPNPKSNPMVENVCSILPLRALSLYHLMVTITLFMIIRRIIFFSPWNTQISKFNNHIQQSDYSVKKIVIRCCHSEKSLHHIGLTHHDVRPTHFLPDCPCGQHESFYKIDSRYGCLPNYFPNDILIIYLHGYSQSIVTFFTIFLTETQNLSLYRFAFSWFFWAVK